MDATESQDPGLTLGPTGAVGSIDYGLTLGTTNTVTMTVGGGGTSYNLSTPMGGGGTSYNLSTPSTISTNGIYSNSIWSNPTVKIDSKLQLNGQDADIVVNGESLLDTLHSIQDRLNMLRPNHQLESEWDQLRELGEAYRRLETELMEKQKMWQTLKQMPEPEIK
jgi:hypothetical protein